MRYKVGDMIDEKGRLKKIPKGFSSIEIKGHNRVVLFNDRMSILLTKVYKDVYAVRIATKGRIQYKFLRADDTLPLNHKTSRDKENYLIDAVDKVISDIEKYTEVAKSREILFYLYLIKGCLKGNMSSCNELQDLITYETIE